MKQVTIWLTLFLTVLIGANPSSAASEPLASGEGSKSAQATTIAGTGAAGEWNGPALAASFRQPMGIAVLPDGTAYVADSSNHVIRKIAAGIVSAHAGLTVFRDAKGLPAGTLLDGPLNQSMFQQPQGLNVDKQGNVYVADAGNHAIRKITPQGVVTTIAGDGVQGYRDGRGKEARFHSPSALTVADDGTVYVTDTLNHAIRKISPDGQVTTLNSLSDRIVVLAGGYAESAGDFRDGKLLAAKFNEPSGIALDSQGNLYVSDSGNQRIRYIDLKNETVSTVAGGSAPVYQKDSLYSDGAYADGEASVARFLFPKGIAVTAEGGLVIADSMNHAIRYLHAGKVTTLSASFDQPIAVDVDRKGNIWVADTRAQQIRMLAIPLPH